MTHCPDCGHHISWHTNPCEVQDCRCTRPFPTNGLRQRWHLLANGSYIASMLDQHRRNPMPSPNTELLRKPIVAKRDEYPPECVEELDELCDRLQLAAAKLPDHSKARQFVDKAERSLRRALRVVQQ